MSPLALFWLIRIGAVLALSGALVAGYTGWASHQRNIGWAEATAQYNIKLDAQKAAAQALLAAEISKAEAATKALREAKDKQENEDVKNAKIIAGLSGKLRAARVFRDPGAAGCGSSGGSTAAGSTPSASGGDADPAKTSGVLSTAATEFLLQQTLEADEINVAYTSCRTTLLKGTP